MIAQIQESSCRMAQSANTDAPTAPLRIGSDHCQFSQCHLAVDENSLDGTSCTFLQVRAADTGATAADVLRFILSTDPNVLRIHLKRSGQTLHVFTVLKNVSARDRHRVYGLEADIFEALPSYAIRFTTIPEALDGGPASYGELIYERGN